MNFKAFLFIFASLACISSNAMQTVQKQITKPVTQYVTSKTAPLLERLTKSVSEYLPSRTASTPKTTPLSPAITTQTITKTVQPKTITQPKKLTEKYTSYTTRAVPKEGLLQKYLYTPSSITLNKLLAAGTTAGSFFGWFSTDNKQQGITQTEDGRYVSHLADMSDEKAKQELRNFLRNYPDSPTAVGLLAVLDEPELIKSWNVSYWSLERRDWKKQVDDLMPLMVPLMRKESELNKQGYYTGVHGESWQLELAENWSTKIWEAVEEKKASDFILAHINKPITSLTQEEEIRKGIIETAHEFHHLSKENENDSCYRRAHANGLFLNPGLFYNVDNPGSSSEWALLSDSSDSEKGKRFTLKSIFACYNLEEIYSEYKPELTQLAEKHAALHKQGHLLLAAIPKNMIEQSVIETNQSYDYIIDGIDVKHDVKAVLDTLRTDPKKVTARYHGTIDKMAWRGVEFALIMTGDKSGGLNPESGVKFFEFNTIDPKKLAAYKAEESALLQRIHDDIVSGKKYTHVKAFTEKLHKELAP